jgi:glycosyltransferase involved in cell wall biosynthesis
MLTIVHVIGGLNIGGAERMLQRLVMTHREQSNINIIVISLTDLGIIGKELRASNVRVETMHINHLLPALFIIPKLVFLLRRIKPDLVQTWLYWADFLGGLSAKIAGVRAIAWNIRCTLFGSSSLTGRLVKLNAFLSNRIPTSIICCGNEAMRFHKLLGYDSERMTMLPNGYDLAYFDRPFASIRNTKRKIEVIAIGRNDPLKDYATLISAAEIAREQFPNIHFSIYGKNCVGDPALTNRIAELDLYDTVDLREEVTDVRVTLLEADLFVSSSISEGFPNVIAEAMAMYVPCVATDAGDAAIIVGNAGDVVPINDPRALARALVKLANLNHEARQALGSRARKQIVENFEIGYVAQHYLDHYIKLIKQGNHEKY